MNQWSFSQTTYPKKIVINNDTLIVISEKQLYDVNMLIINYHECQELLKIEKKESFDKQSLINIQDSALITAQKLISNKDEENIILSDQKKILEKKIKRQQIKTKVGIPLGVIFGFGIGLLIFK